MRKVFTFIAYTIVLLFIGRNLTFLPKINPLTNPQKETAEVEKDIKKMIHQLKGNYSLYYASLINDTHFGINEKQTFIGASVNKVPLVTTLYALASKGKINLEESITLTKDDIQDYGTGKLRYEKPGSTYSLKTLAQLSLQQSDNTAAHIIATRIGMDVVQKMVNEWGLSQTNMANNKTSPYDMYLIFRKIYNGEIANPSLTKELLEFFTDSDFEDRLPVYLPKGALVYHKTGDTIGGLHDVGIIENNGKAFYLGVMTSDIADKENETKQLIGIIAKKVFGFTQELQ